MVDLHNQFPNWYNENLQINYILGANPRKISYLVGYGSKYPEQVHHRGASTPRHDAKCSCTGGWKWRDSRGPNPNVITGAMVGGPDQYDQFLDVRNDGDHTEPTLAANAGLVSALVSLARGIGMEGIDENTIFSSVPPLFPPATPSPPKFNP